MKENPYEPTPETAPPNAMDSADVAAGIGSRLVAYLIDVLPITCAMWTFYYFFLGFDETWTRYTTSPSDIDARVAFLVQRSQVRDLSFVVYVLYCSFMECSEIQGTFGKKLLGIRVTDVAGQRLTFVRSLGRNLAKYLSAIPLGIGFLWAVFSKRNRGWHDIIAKTLVVK